MDKPSNQPTVSSHVFYHLRLLWELHKQLKNLQQRTPDQVDDELSQLLEQLEQLLPLIANDNIDYDYRGQEFVLHFISGFSEIVPLLHPDLYWFFGGQCLHYMPDEDIERYQILEDMRFSSEAAKQDFDWAKQRAEIFAVSKDKKK